ncbi:MAG: tyrosine-type recombinase/integrase [Proteobacteria bacterium]|nr:tyrosine-type recombinase/integrase [Pseudomonadota bacterium]
MSKIRLTQVAVDKVRPPAAGRVELFDTHLPGFGLRVSATGAKSWFLFYRAAGRQRRYTVGTLAAIPKVEDARDRARALLHDVARGIDPADARDAEPAPAPVTVAALAADFINRHAKVKNRSWRGTERLLALHVLPAWGKRPASSIAYHDVEALLDVLADGGHPILANRALASIRKMFNWSVGRRILPVSPAAGVKPPGKEVERQRVLTDAELVIVWRAAEAVGGATGAFVRLLALTGQRRNEVAGMRWADIDYNRPVIVVQNNKEVEIGKATVWTLPRESTKADRSHEVPLAPQAIEILAALPRGGEFVLSTTGGTRPVSGYSKIKAKLDALTEAEAGAPLAPWRFHDLRRTAGTGLARLGTPVSTISRVLGHAEGGVTKIYNRHGYLPEKCTALDAWARYVAALIRPAEDNVIPMKRA